MSGWNKKNTGAKLKLALLAWGIICSTYSCNSINEYSSVVDFKNKCWTINDTVKFNFKPVSFSKTGTITLAIRHQPQKNNQTTQIVVKTHNKNNKYALDTININLQPGKANQIITNNIEFKKNIAWTTLKNYHLEIYPTQNLNNIYSISIEVKSAQKAQ